MYTVETQRTDNASPEGYSRVAFDRPNGRVCSAVVPIPADWPASVVIDPGSGLIFLVSGSPDGRQLRVDRWLAHHAPRTLAFKTKKEQREATGGLDVASHSAEEIVHALLDQLTEGDKFSPTPVVDAEGLAPVDGEAVYSPKPAKWSYRFGHHSGSMATHTKPNERPALFRNGAGNSFFVLHDRGDSWLLEIMDLAERHRRLEVTVSKDEIPSQVPVEVVVLAAAQVVPGVDTLA